MKFYVYENKDAARAYVNALEQGGFERVEEIEAADFLLYDSEGVGERREAKAQQLKQKPGFIYPHTPFTCYIWDGIYTPLPVACNFVAGEGPRQCMKAYGYPYRVETSGFPRCEVRAFTPTQGRNLLFIPARPRRDKGRQAALDLTAFKFIADNRDHFENVTVCRLKGQLDYPDGYKGIKFITTNPKGTPTPGDDMIRRIEAHDLVISVTTPAALAVARGVPTIMYGQHETPETLTGQRARNYEKYRHIYPFPLTLEDMDIEAVMRVRENQNSATEFWKRQHIGGSFDADKFLSIVREYV